MSTCGKNEALEGLKSKQGELDGLLKGGKDNLASVKSKLTDMKADLASFKPEIPKVESLQDKVSELTGLTNPLEKVAAIQAMKDKFGSGFNVDGLLTNLGLNNPLGALSNPLDAAQNALGNPLDAANNALGNPLGAAQNALGGAQNALNDPLGAAQNALGGQVGGAIGGAQNALNNPLGAAQNALGGAGGAIDVCGVVPNVEATEDGEVKEQPAEPKIPKEPPKPEPPTEPTSVDSEEANKSHINKSYKLAYSTLKNEIKFNFNQKKTVEILKVIIPEYWVYAAGLAGSTLDDLQKFDFKEADWLAKREVIAKKYKGSSAYFDRFPGMVDEKFTYLLDLFREKGYSFVEGVTNYEDASKDAVARQLEKAANTST
jgi:hypothetical protein